MHRLHPEGDGSCTSRKTREQLFDKRKGVKTRFHSAANTGYLFQPTLKRCVQAQRLFRDRLADSESKKRFDGMLTAQLRSSWGHTADLNGVSDFHQHCNAFEADELSKRVARKESRRGRRA